MTELEFLQYVLDNIDDTNSSIWKLIEDRINYLTSDEEG